MALKIKASARSAALSVPGSSVPDRFRTVYAAVSAPDPFVSARSVPVPDAVPAPSAAVPVPVQESTPAPSAAGSAPVPVSAPSSGSVSVLVRMWYRDYIVQVSIPGYARPRYISRCYRGRYTLTSDPLYARAWSNPDLAWHHALTLKEKLIDDPSSIR